MPEPRPIVLTAAQARAALAGETVELRRKLRKAEWRLDGHPIRLTKSEAWGLLEWNAARLDPGPSPAGNLGPYWHVPINESEPLFRTTHRLYPFLRPGDRVWVREAWALAHRNTWGGLPKTIGPDGHEAAYYREGFDRSPPRWQSPATMPRWASRLTLTVTGLRLEPGEERPFVVEARRDG